MNHGAISMSVAHCTSPCCWSVTMETTILKTISVPLKFNCLKKDSLQVQYKHLPQNQNKPKGTKKSSLEPGKDLLRAGVRMGYQS